MEVSLEELRRLTRATHSKKVCKVLAQAGVAYKLDAAGSPIVLRASIDRAFGLAHDTASSTEIDMSARLARLKEKDRGKKTTKRPGPAT